MAIHQSWYDSAEQAEAAVASETTRCGGTYLGHAVVACDGGRYRLDLDLEPASWRGKSGYIARCDLPCDDGSANYEVWTDDGDVAGPFASASQATTWAKQEGVKVRPGVTPRKSSLTG